MSDKNSKKNKSIGNGKTNAENKTNSNKNTENSIPNGENEVKIYSDIDNNGKINIFDDTNISDLLSHPFDKYSKELAVSLQIDVNAVASCILIAVATATQGNFNVQPKPTDKTWLEELNIGLILSGHSSEKKSPLLENVFKPITDSDNLYNEKNKVIINQNIAELETLKAKRDSQIKELASNKKNKNPDITDETLAKIVEDIETFNKPTVFKQSTASDITPEALVMLMDEQGEKMTIFDDEGTILKIASGMYNGGNSNIDIILKGMSNNTYIQNRVGRKKTILKKPCLSALISVQPKVIKSLLNNEEFQDRGLLGRFFKIEFKSLIGYRNLDSKPVSEKTYKEYEKSLMKIAKNEILSIDNNNNINCKPVERSIKNEFKTLTLDTGAYKILKEFHNEIEQQININFEHIASYAGKLIGRTARIAGILHIMEDAQNTETPFKSKIRTSIMEKAIKISRYFLSQELGLYKKSVQTLDVQRAEKIIKRLREKQSIKGYTAKEIKQLIRSKELEVTNDTPTETIEPSLELLKKRGYLKPEKNKYYPTEKLLK